jgi:hypothetical protein
MTDTGFSALKAISSIFLLSGYTRAVSIHFVCAARLPESEQFCVRRSLVSNRYRSTIARVGWRLVKSERRGIWAHSQTLVAFSRTAIHVGNKLNTRFSHLSQWWLDLPAGDAMLPKWTGKLESGSIRRWPAGRTPL